MDGDDTNNSDNEFRPSVPTALAIPNRGQDALTECVRQIVELQENAGEQGQISVNVSLNVQQCENLQLGGTQQINTGHPDEKKKAKYDIHPVSRFAMGNAREHVERIKTSRVFVITKLVKKIEHVLRCLPSVIVVGNPGQGKTENCIYMLYVVTGGEAEGFGKDWEPYIISDPKEFERIFDRSKKQIILIDDFLGRTHFIECNLQKWLKLFEKIKGTLKKHQTRILFTSRKHIFLEGIDQLRRYDSILGENNIIDLTEVLLEREEKCTILRKYLDEVGIKICEKDCISQVGEPIAKSTVSQSTVSRILDCDDVNVLGFPFCCCTFVTSRNFLVKKENFFQKPTLSLCEEIEIIRKTDRIKYVTLVCILLSGGCLNINTLDEFRVSPEERDRLEEIARACGQRGVNLQMIREAADSLVGSFLKQDGIVFKYIHESLMDAVCICLGQNHNDKALQYCSIDVLLEFVGTTNSEIDCDKMILISDKQCETTVIERLFQALENTTDAERIMCHKLFDDDNFVKHFFEVMEQSERLHRVINIKGDSTNTFLFWACKLGRLRLLDCLLKAGGNLSEENCYGETVLHLACRDGKLQVIEKLTEHCLPYIIIKHDAKGKTPLHVACENGWENIVHHLLQCGAKSSIHAQDKFGRTPLHLACGHSKINVEKCLSVLRRLFLNDAASDICKIDEFGKTPLHCAIIHGRIEVVKQLLENVNSNDIAINDRGGRTPLHLACKHNAWTIAELLIKHGANSNTCDREGRTPLHSACVGGGVETVMVLLKNRPSQCIMHVDETGKTPLHLACMHGTLEIVNQLLMSGASIHAIDDQRRTSLHIACRYSGSVIVNVLLQQGAKLYINTTDKGGNSPLHFACRPDGMGVVKELLIHGANIHIRDINGKTPLHLAVGLDSQLLVTILMQYGASTDLHATDDFGKTPFDSAKLPMKENISDLMRQ